MKSCDCGAAHNSQPFAFDFCWLYLGFKIHKSCVYLWRLSWWTKLCWSQSLFSAI